MNPFEKLIYSIKTITIHSQADWQKIESTEKEHHDVITHARALAERAARVSATGSNRVSHDGIELGIDHLLPVAGKEKV